MKAREFEENLQSLIKKITSADQKQEPNEHWLYTAEKLLTLNELENLLQTIEYKQDTTLTPELAKVWQSFLSNRWKRIQNTDLAYPHASHDPISKICLILAEIIAPIIEQNPYQTLMPTLEAKAVDIYLLKPLQERLRDPELKLNHFILSDDNSRIIEIFPCLNSAEEDGILKHTTLFEKASTKALSKEEITRVTLHSNEARYYHHALQQVIKTKKNSNYKGSYIQRLIDQLRRGGVSGGHGGEELKAGCDANIGIVEFSRFIDSLNQDEKQQFFAVTAPRMRDTIGTLWGRLARPHDTNFKETRYCVQLIANSLESILEHNKDLFSYEADLKNKETNRVTAKKNLETILQKTFNNQVYRESGREF